MIIRLYDDEDSMRHALVSALRTQRIDLLTALEAKMVGRKDEEMVNRVEFLSAWR